MEIHSGFPALAWVDVIYSKDGDDIITQYRCFYVIYLNSKLLTMYVYFNTNDIIKRIIMLRTIASFLRVFPK